MYIYNIIIYIIYTYIIRILLHIIDCFDYVYKHASRQIKNIGKHAFSSKLNGVELWPFEVWLICIMNRFSMYYVQIEACLIWIAVQTGSPFGSLGSLRSLASVHVEATCEISLILSLVPDSPNHPTDLPDRARRLPDMSPIKHQASLANSMDMCT